MYTYDGLIRSPIPGVSFHQNRYGDSLSTVVREGCVWIDLGAGGALHRGWECSSSQDLAQEPALLVGVDLEIGSLKGNPDIDVPVIADASALPFRSCGADVVSANMVLEHLANPAAAFAEIARMLTPNGEFIFVTPNRHHPIVFVAGIALKRRWRTLLSMVVERRAEEDIFETHYRANTKAQLARLAADAGMLVDYLEEVFSWPFFRRPLIMTAVECLWIRLASSLGLRRFGSNILGNFRKPDRASATDRRLQRVGSTP
jgi:SAM-dependent methyltransferase